MPLLTTAGIAGLVLISIAAAAYLPPAIDWHTVFYPATQALLHGSTPYAFDFHNPPWALLPLVPFTVHETIGRGMLFAVSLAVYAGLAIWCKAHPVGLAFWLLSPPILHTLLHGNLEWLVLLGLALPPRWGLFTVLIKPQVAGMVAVWWTVEAWRKGKCRAVWVLWWPVTLAFAISVVLFGWWPASAAAMPNQWWNASLWPWSIAPGTVLLGLSLYRRNWRYALAASPMLSPYVLLHAWAGALLATVHHTKFVLFIVLSLWALLII